MAIGLPSLLKGIEIAWEIITSTYEPLNAGETFTAMPYAYVEGTYNFRDADNFQYNNQNAYLKYDSGNFLIMGESDGGGNFSINAYSGTIEVSYAYPYSIWWCNLSIKGGKTFEINRGSGYETRFGTADVLRIYGNSQVNSYYDTSVSSPYVCFYFNSGQNYSSGNVTNGNWNLLINDQIPIIAGNSYTYYDALDIYINYYNNKYTDLSLTREDFPPESDYLPQEPTTEPISGGFDIDYDEIMSPSEFDAVLNSAEYDLEEIPTTFALDLPELPDETLPTGMLSFAGNIVNASYSYYNALGLSGVLISVGVIVCVIRLLRGR